MLTALRNSAQSWLIKSLLGLIVVTFVISFGVGTFSNPKEVLVRIGSDEIMVAQYLEQYREELDQLRRRFPENAEILANQLNLREQVMNRMVNRHLILKTARQEGLQVMGDELQEAVTRDPSFQVNGRFDFDTYQQILSQIRRTPETHETMIREDLLVGRYQRNLLAGVIVNELEVNERYRIEKQNVEVDFLFVDPQQFKLSKPPTKEEIQAHYQAHPAPFTQPAQFRVRYFILSLADEEKGQKVHPRAVERYYQRNLETEFSSPKKVKASHILKKIGKDDPPEKEILLRQEMEKLLARAKKGEDFAKLAGANSDDFSKEKGGDLGFFGQDDMVPAFSDAAFSLPKGGISNIVRSPFGLHIIKVTAIQPGVSKSLEAVREEIEQLLMERLAERKLKIDLERLPPRMEKEGMEVVAKSLGASLTETELFDSNGTLPTIISTSGLYAQIQSRRKGHIGVFRRNPVQGHVFFEVLEKKNAFVKPLADVKSLATRLTREEKQREAALASAKKAIKELKTETDFKAYAQRYFLPTQSARFSVVDSTIEGLGKNPDFQRSAFRLDKAKPFALNIKDNKAYLIQFKRRFFPEPTKEKEDKDQIRQQITATLRQYIANKEIERLRADVGIEVVSPQYVLSGQRPLPPQ